jgi:transposase
VRLTTDVIALMTLSARTDPDLVTWSLFPPVQNLGALRGLDTIAGAGLAAAIGDPSRFASAPDLMAYLRFGAIGTFLRSQTPHQCYPKGGDIHARTLLIEAAHSYRFPAHIAQQTCRP